MAGLLKRDKVVNARSLKKLAMNFSLFF